MTDEILQLFGAVNPCHLLCNLVGEINNTWRLVNQIPIPFGMISFPALLPGEGIIPIGLFVLWSQYNSKTFF